MNVGREGSGAGQGPVPKDALAGLAREASAWGRYLKVVRRFRRNRMALGAAVVLVCLAAISLAAPLLASHSPETIELGRRFASPGGEHLLGTDENGRDILARLLYGGRVSLGIGLTAMLFAIAAGTILGGTAGFLGGWVDVAVMRVTDAMLSFPLFFFMLTVLALWGSSTPKIIAVIAATSWMNVARVVRGEVLQTRSREFIEAAHALGAPWGRILFRHVLPHSVPSIIVAATLGVAWAILTESALSYLGLGVQPPAPSWGNMLSGARSYMWSAPQLAFYPGAMIFVTVLAFNALGDGLRDALDPTANDR